MQPIYMDMDPWSNGPLVLGGTTAGIAVQVVLCGVSGLVVEGVTAATGGAVVQAVLVGSEHNKHAHTVEAHMVVD